jgi:hypothetical protein
MLFFLFVDFFSVDGVKAGDHTTGATVPAGSDVVLVLLRNNVSGYRVSTLEKVGLF